MKSQALKANKGLKIILGVFVLLALTVFAVGLYYALRVKGEVSTISTQAVYLDKESQDKTEVAQRYNRISDYSPVVFDSIPSNKEISSFLADIEEIAKRNDIAITQSSIGATNAKKQANLDFSQTISQKDYYELQIKYTVEGSYQSFLNTLDELSALRRLNIVSDVNIIKNSLEGKPDSVQINFVDSIYIKK